MKPRLVNPIAQSNLFGMKLLGTVLVLSTICMSQADWWETASYYQIYPRSFKDSNGDGIGDLRGIADKLSYLKDMGLTATWLSPIYQSPLIDYGYDISDFYAIGPEYGTMQDFEYLMQKSNETGVKVLMDFVPNHSSDENECFNKSVNSVEPYTDFYIWHPGKVDPNNSSRKVPPCNWQAIGYGTLGDAWTWNDKRAAFYYHQFAVKQPDLNFRNPKVHDEMRNVLKFWLDKGVAGFRVDAITHMYEVAPSTNNSLPDEPVSGDTNDTSDYGYLKHIYTADQNETFDLVYEWREFLDAYVKANGGETRILMTESYSAIETIQRYYTNGTVKGAHLPFNFELMKQLRSNSTANDVVKAVHSWLDPMPKGYFTNWVMGNHDGSRVATRMGREKVDLYNALVMVLPGTSVTYYGDEIGSTDVCITVDPNTKDFLRCNDTTAYPFMREFCRTPFQWDASANGGFSNGSKTWLPLSENFQSVNLATQLATTGSHADFYKRLMTIKKSEAAQNGTLSIKALNSDVLVIERELSGKGGENLITIFNFGGIFVNLKFINETEKVNQITVKISRLNSFHSAGSKVTLSDVELAPFDLLVGTYSNRGIVQASSMILSILSTIVINFLNFY